MRVSVGAGFIEDSADYNIMEIAIVADQRMYGDKYKRVMMEMIPADDYSANHQSLFLYVNNIEK